REGFLGSRDLPHARRAGRWRGGWRNRRRRQATTLPSPHLLLVLFVARVVFLPRIVGRIDIVDLKWSCAVQLDDRFPLGHGEMAHGLGHPHVRTRRHFLHLGGIEPLARADPKSALQYGDVLIAGMPVGWDLVAIWQLGPEDIGHARLTGIADQYRHLG